MPSTVFDSDIFKDVFGTPEMRAVFSDDNLLKCYMGPRSRSQLRRGAPA
jgi:3-carboxy-cis,cis-muconate cycloisomerase